jgi:uncharacterized protein (TIGR03067 family)
MRPSALLLALIALWGGVGAAPPPKPDPARAELKKLQGRWLLQTTRELGMTTWDARDHEERRVQTIQDDRWVQPHPGVRSRITALDARCKCFDLVFTVQGHTLHFEAIYRLQGDTLQVCFRRGKGNRPTGFTTPTEPDTILYTYKRLKGD